MPISIIRTSGESPKKFIGANWEAAESAVTLPILGSIHIFVIFVFHWDANYALFTHTDTDAVKLQIQLKQQQQ